MLIRKASIGDCDKVHRILQSGADFLHECGVNQWTGGYPSYETVQNDIQNENCYVIEKDGIIVCAFTAIYGADSTYEKIYDGSWLNNTDNYYTVHRIAVHSDYRGQSLAGMAYDYAEKLCIKNNAISLRIDTHKDNKANLSAIEKYGFTYCGIIYTETGEPRVAYEKIIESEIQN